MQAAFPLQQLLHEHASVFHYTYVGYSTCLVLRKCVYY